MAKKNTFEWTDVLAYGSDPKNNFNETWNGLHDKLVKAEFPPMYEIYTRDYYMSELVNDDYGFGKEICDIVIGFMESEQISEMLITR